MKLTLVVILTAALLLTNTLTAAEKSSLPALPCAAAAAQQPATAHETLSRGLGNALPHIADAQAFSTTILEKDALLNNYKNKMVDLYHQRHMYVSTLRKENIKLLHQSESLKKLQPHALKKESAETVERVLDEKAKEDHKELERAIVRNTNYIAVLNTQIQAVDREQAELKEKIEKLTLEIAVDGCAVLLASMNRGTEGLQP